MATCRGFTLLECMVAIVIIGTAVVAGLQALGSQKVLAAQETATWEAVLHLGNAAEQVRVTDYDQLQSTAFAPTDENPDYEVGHTVTDVSADCVQIEIAVRWTSLSGQYNRRSLVTYRCKDVN